MNIKNNEKKTILDDMNVFFNGNNLFKIKEMKTDIIEETDRYVLNIDIPGIKKEDISITFNDGYLSVYVSKVEEKEEAINYIKRERISQAITRKYYLGCVDEEKIKAKLENGVLNILAYKLDDSSNKNIKIE